ncbi:MAG: DUF975 family protein [Bacteroidales bacterium]
MDKKIVLKQMLCESFKILKDNILILLGLILLSGVISFAFSISGSFISSKPLSIGVSIISCIIQYYIALMLVKFSLKILKGEDPDFCEIVPSFRQLGMYILSMIIILLPILLCCLPLVGIVFFNDLYRNPTSLIPIILVCFLIVIIASVFIITNLSFVSYYIIDRNSGPIKAIKQSVQLSKGFRGFIFLSYVLLIVGLFLGALALIVGLFIVLAWAQVYYALLFTKIQKIKSTTDIDDDIAFEEINEIDSKQYND